MFEIIKEALKHLFSKPDTINYPLSKREVGHEFRGRHVFMEERCTACGLCEERCPSQCIKLLEDEKRIIIDLDACMFCGLCRDVCPVDAIQFSDEYELATSNKEELFVD